MFRNLALIGLCIAVVPGCRDEEPGPVDLSRAGLDLSVNPNDDLSMMQNLTNTTPHDVDTGAVASGTLVKMSGLLIMSRVVRHQSNTSGYCEYRVMAQDPMCNTPPCGIELYTRGVKLPLDAGTTDCPFHDKSSTPFKDISGDYGQQIEVTGSVKSFPDSMGTVVLHSLTVDTLVAGTKMTLPAPFAVTDTDPSKFIPHTGAGWNQYEGTYIKLSPASGKFTIGTVDSFGEYSVTPGGAHFSTDFYFGPKDAGTFPVMGTQYSSIAGVVVNDFGGVINPILGNDYQP